MKLFVENPEPAKGAANTVNKLKSTAPTNSTVGLGAKPGSLRRVFLMRDRKTNESWRYGFAEFATVEDAIAAVAKFRASARFTIASKPVMVAFIHTGVFVPEFDTGTENQDFSFSPIYNPAVRVKYWDERAYPSARVVSSEPLPGAPSPGQAPGNDDAAKSAAKSSKKIKSTKEPAPVAKVTMMPQMQLWAKASAQLHGAKQATDAAAAAVEEPHEAQLAVPLGASRETDDTQPDGPVAPQQGDQYISYGDWEAMSCLACDWEAPTQAHIDQHGWPQTRGDLLIEHEGRAHNFFKDDEAKVKAASALAALGREPRPIVRRTPRLKSERLPVYKSYADFDRLRCVLCKRAFKDTRLIWLHEQQSELHKRMLADSINRKRAAEELKRMGKKLRVLEPEAEFKSQWELQHVRFLQPQYRDRALERRRAFRQPKHGGGGATVPEKRKEPAETAEEPAAKKSKGAGMLAKMGWTAGAGLGAEGAGRTEAIATEVYAPGVGLGAEGGKLGDAGEEAARNTRGDFAAFVQKTKNRARERFERM
jgi:RNA recognition motif-containing protein